MGGSQNGELTEKWVMFQISICGTDRFTGMVNHWIYKLRLHLPEEPKAVQPAGFTPPDQEKTSTQKDVQTM